MTTTSEQPTEAWFLFGRTMKGSPVGQDGEPRMQFLAAVKAKSIVAARRRFVKQGLWIKGKEGTSIILVMDDPYLTQIAEKLSKKAGS
jgi:hypothetical protein